MTPTRPSASPAPVPPEVPRSWPARAALVLLAAMWLGAGWFFLLQGRLASTHRYSRDVTVVDQPAAVAFVCAVFFALAALAALVVLRSLQARRLAQWAVMATVLLPPVAWWVMR